MGPVEDLTTKSGLMDKVPSTFDGHEVYASYREHISFWIKLTTLPPEKHGRAII